LADPLAVVVWHAENAEGGSHSLTEVAVALRVGPTFRLLAVPEPVEDILPIFIQAARIIAGRVVVEGLAQGPNDGNCCPSVPVGARTGPAGA